jgi:hypothetical protein
LIKGLPFISLGLEIPKSFKIVGAISLNLPFLELKLYGPQIIKGTGFRE